MFDGVWSPNISRLERPYRNKLKVSFIGVFLNTRINKTDCTNKKGPKCWYRRAKLLYRDATDYNSVSLYSAARPIQFINHSCQKNSAELTIK